MAADVTPRLAVLDDARVEASWVEATLRDFDRLWELMSPDNRDRLVHALVAEVVVDEPAGTIELRMADLGAAEAAA